MNRDQFLTEKVLGECWHDGIYHEIAKCKKCSMPYPKNNNFSTPEGFFKLWNFCKEQEWWDKFTESYPHKSWLIPIAYINPDIFSEVIAKYRGWKGE